MRIPYTLLLDESLVKSIELRHETDSIEAHIERLLAEEQKAVTKPSQNILQKLLTYTKNSLGYGDVSNRELNSRDRISLAERRKPSERP